MNERNSRCRRCRNTRLPKETETEVSFCGTSWENDRFIGAIVGRETLALARTIARESNGAEPGSKLKFLFSFVCTNNNNEITCASRLPTATQTPIQQTNQPVRIVCLSDTLYVFSNVQKRKRYIRI